MRCISNQKITPEKSEMMKAFSAAQLAKRMEGKVGGSFCLPLLLFFSLWGLCWVSWLRLFLLFSCLHLWLSHSHSGFSFLNPFLFLSHPLLIPSYPVLCLSQGFNLWLWSYRNIGMATHALLCFVSLLACWLAHWLAGPIECVFTLYSCHTVCMLPLSKNVHLSLFLVSLFVVTWLLVCLLLVVVE